MCTIMYNVCVNMYMCIIVKIDVYTVCMCRYIHVYTVHFTLGIVHCTCTYSTCMCGYVRIIVKVLYEYDNHMTLMRCPDPKMDY